MSIEKLTALTDSFASVVEGELVGRLPEAERQAWVDLSATFPVKTDAESLDILDYFGATLLGEPVEGVEDVLKSKKPVLEEGEEDVQTPLERKAEAERTKLTANTKIDDATKQVELLDVFSGDGAIEANNANEAKCIGALIREDYLTASLYAAICGADCEADAHNHTANQAAKLATLR